MAITKCLRYAKVQFLMVKYCERKAFHSPSDAKERNIDTNFFCRNQEAPSFWESFRKVKSSWKLPRQCTVYFFVLATLRFIIKFRDDWTSLQSKNWQADLYFHECCSCQFSDGLKPHGVKKYLHDIAICMTVTRVRQTAKSTMTNAASYIWYRKKSALRHGNNSWWNISPNKVREVGWRKVRLI